MNKFVIVGLGNKGEKYNNTRHNIGFQILDELIIELKKQGYLFKEEISKKLKSKIISNNNLIFIYPLTYMNNSGEAVRAVLDWYKIKNLNNLCIIHDDISLDLGRIKWVKSRGAGGQHGIESIIQHLQSKDFIRLRFGIGPDPGGENRSTYVLNKFLSTEIELLNKTLNLALKSLKEYLKQEKSLETIMNEFN